MNFLDDVGNLL